MLGHVLLWILQDYNHQLAQLRAGKSSKSKLLLAKFKSPESLTSWEVRQGTYFQDVVAAKYDGGIDAKFEFTESGEALFSGNNCLHTVETYFFFSLFFFEGHDIDEKSKLNCLLQRIPLRLESGQVY